MKIEQEGYEYRGFRLGDVVKNKKNRRCEKPKILSREEVRELENKYNNKYTGSLLTGDLSISEQEINKIKLSGTLDFVKVVKEIIEHKDEDWFELCLNNEKWIVLIEDKKYCVCDYSKKIIKATYLEVFEIVARILYDEKEGDFYFKYY